MKPSLDLTTLLSVALLVFVGLRSHWTGRLLALLLLSPGLRYGLAVFGFPIRLQLSAWAGTVLRWVGMNVAVQGNVLIRDGLEMAVDPACMGLQMTGVSLLVALFLLIWLEKQRQCLVPVGWVLTYGLAAFGLTIVCNLFRIVLLVAFGAMPGTVSHEVIGLVCVVTYAWVPAWVLAKMLIRYAGRAVPDAGQEASRRFSPKSIVWGVGVIGLGVGLMAFASRPTEAIARVDASVWQTIGVVKADYTQKQLANGTWQLTAPNTLIYLKPQPDWFSSDHSPMVCWRGSGYDLQHIRETTLNGHPAYRAELVRNGQIWQTAWWFTNGRITTISQLTLRGQMLRGETGFALVNVTRQK